MYTHKSISTEHHKIHEGDAFAFSSLIEDLAAAATDELLFVTSASDYVHMKEFSVASTGGSILLEVWEDVTATNGATTLEMINRNRNSSTTSNLAIYTAPTSVSETGCTKIFQTFIGGSDGFRATGGGDGGSLAEYVLLPSTKYLLRITNNGAAAADIFVSGFMYKSNVSH